MSPGFLRIETHYAAEHFRCTTRHTLSGCRQLNYKLRQSPMASMPLPPRSLMPRQGAPALRHAARRGLDPVPPPRQLVVSAKATGGPHCSSPRSAACAFAEHQAQYAHEAQHSAFAGINRCGVSPLWRG